MAITHRQVGISRGVVKALHTDYGRIRKRDKPDLKAWLEKQLEDYNLKMLVVQGDDLRSVVDAIMDDWDSYA